MASDKEQNSELLTLTTEIVASHVANNTVAATDLPALIATVYASLARLAGGAEPVPEKLEPAVPIKASIKPDYIICLEDGKKLKMLKRHLRTQYGLSPEDYRAKWKLPADYPMVAPNYAKQRQTLAKQIGLGTKRGRRKK